MVHSNIPIITEGARIKRSAEPITSKRPRNPPLSQSVQPLIPEGATPVILFEKKNGKWTRKFLSGYNTVASVEKFVQKAAIRTADLDTPVLEKK